MTKFPGETNSSISILQRRKAASQRALALAMRENRIRDECLAIATEALLEIATRPRLRNAAPSARKIAAAVLDKIKIYLAELEPEEKHK